MTEIAGYQPADAERLSEGDDGAIHEAEAEITKQLMLGMQVGASYAEIMARVAAIKEKYAEKKAPLIADALKGELDGEQLPGRPANVCYVKLVPLTPEEAKSWQVKRSTPRERTSIATFDGHSWIWPFRPTTAAELAEEFRGFEDSDVGKWWFQVTGADLVNYPSKVGTYPGEGTTDFLRYANGWSSIAPNDTMFWTDHNKADTWAQAASPSVTMASAIRAAAASESIEVVTW